MEEHVKDWEKEHPTLQWEETFEEFCERAKKTAETVPEEAINRCLAHTKTVLARLVKAKGWYIDG